MRRVASQPAPEAAGDIAGAGGKVEEMATFLGGQPGHQTPLPQAMDAEAEYIAQAVVTSGYASEDIIVIRTEPG